MLYSKTILHLILIISLAYFSSAGQTGLTWQRSVDGPGSESTSMATTDPSGNLIAVGVTNGSLDLDPGPTVLSPIALGMDDIYLQKFDPNGNLMWGKRFGGPDLDLPYDVAVNGNSEIFISGNFIGTADLDPGPGTYTIASTNGNTTFIQKLSSSGNLLWVKSFTFMSNIKIEVDAEGSVYVCGDYGANCDFDPGPATYTLNYAWTTCVFVLKLSSQGNFMWVKSIAGNPGNNLFTSTFSMDANKQLLMVGRFDGTADFDPGAGVSTLTTTSGTSDAYLLKLDSLGNFVWVSQITKALVFDAVFDNLGNVLAAGSASNSADFDPGSNTFLLSGPGTSRDGFLLKLNSANGSFAWVKGFLKTSGSNIYSVRCFQNNEILITGVFKDSCDLDPGLSTLTHTSLGTPLFFAKFTTVGNLSWVKVIDSVGIIVGNAIISPNEDVYLRGGTRGVFNINPGAGMVLVGSPYSLLNDVAFVAKYNVKTLGIDEQSEDDDILIYPNPSDGRFFVKANKTVLLRIYDSQGMLVLERKIGEKTEEEISSGLGRGVYLIQIDVENNCHQNQKLVID